MTTDYYLSKIRSGATNRLSPISYNQISIRHLIVYEAEFDECWYDVAPKQRLPLIDIADFFMSNRDNIIRGVNRALGLLRRR
jgi:hypothetical protein